MAKVCQQIFSNYTEPRDIEICQSWFNFAVDHCHWQFYYSSQSFWLIKNIFEIGKKLFATNKVYEISTINLTKNPKRLHPNECNELFAAVTKDYVNIVPRYNDCLQENQLIFPLICIIFCVIIVIMFLLFVWRNKSLKNFPKKNFDNTFKIRKSKDSLNSRTESDLSLQRHLYEVKQFKVPKNCFYDLHNGPSLATYEFSTKSEMFCVIGKLTRKPSIDTIIEKKSLKAKHRQCRIIFDFIYFNSDSDDENDEIADESKTPKSILRQKTFVVKGNQNQNMKHDDPSISSEESSTTSTINLNETIRCSKTKRLMIKSCRQSIESNNKIIKRSYKK